MLSAQPCTFIILYKHGPIDIPLTTISSIARFVNQYYLQKHNLSSLIVICDDSKIEAIPTFQKTKGFNRIKILGRNDLLPNEQDFGPFPVISNLASSALNRVSMSNVMIIACGEKIVNDNAATIALDEVSTDYRKAFLSVHKGINNYLVPAAILFNMGPGWSNLNSAMFGTKIDIRKRIISRRLDFSQVQAYTKELTDYDLIAAIAFDYNRDRFRYGEQIISTNWTKN
jgi:hypothetical protein